MAVVAFIMVTIALKNRAKVFFRHVSTILNVGSVLFGVFSTSALVTSPFKYLLLSCFFQGAIASPRNSRKKYVYSSNFLKLLK